MKGRNIPYSVAELAWIKANSTRPRRTAHAEFCTRFGRQDVSMVNFNSLCKRKGWMTGRTGCFQKDQVPHNKGKPFRVAAEHPNCRKTQFKKGELPHSTKYLGHESLRADGYVWVSIDQTNPHTGFERRYVQKHKHLWEQLNGPVPAGHCLKSLDGDRTNCDPANWEAIPRALLPRLVGGRWHKPYDQHEPEARPAVMAIARLEHAVRTAGK